ncbi:MAG: CBS domain-containing protein [Candidatus Omnitrophica bacterium]|nr:CBS domain-containing protein [Candidatus Omnitrophota bacterium]
MLVKEMMTKEIITVSPDMQVRKFADLLIDKNISGAPVVDDQGNLLGLALEKGVMFLDKNVHLPSFIHIAMGFFTFGVKKFEEEIKKVTASKVSEIMIKEYVSFSEDMSVEDAATIMLEKDVYYCPVLKGQKLIGIVTKRDIVRSIAKEA